MKKEAEKKNKSTVSNPNSVKMNPAAAKKPIGVRRKSTKPLETGAADSKYKGERESTFSGSRDSKYKGGRDSNFSGSTVSNYKGGRDSTFTGSTSSKYKGGEESTFSGEKISTEKSFTQLPWKRQSNVWSKTEHEHTFGPPPKTNKFLKQRRSASQKYMRSESLGEQGKLMLEALRIPEDARNLYDVTHGFHPYPGRFHPD